VTSLAASEAAAGHLVDIALFFGALHSWSSDAWDALDPSPPLDARAIEKSGMPPLTTVLQPGRTDDRIKLYACSASVRLLGLDAAHVQTRVDAILGWQSFSRMIGRAKQVVTL